MLLLSFATVFVQLLGEGVFLNIDLREFLPVLVEKSFVDGVIVTGAGLENYLVTDINTGSLGCWSLIVNLEL